MMTPPVSHILQYLEIAPVSGTNRQYAFVVLNLNWVLLDEFRFGPIDSSQCRRHRLTSSRCPPLKT
jgi:hypothetical protein